MPDLLFPIHFAATWYLVGLCWLVQRVQYPLMDRVGLDGFTAYEQGHVTRIGPVVAPMMLIELATGGLLVTSGGETFRNAIFLVALGLLAVIWISTWLVQVPLHGALGKGFDVERHASLVRTNWVRTIAWSLRGGLLLFMLVQMLRDGSA